ncbi:MAG: YchJ family metal-binding protein [Sulfurovum sp.]|nr:YchJ family metal-binding protein [Sulfurovum sp.]
MAKVSPNIPCPCGSRKKYKKCCAIYHKGTLAPDALTLMKSRYSAYASGDAEYIINTTHPSNPDYTADRILWKNDIDLFSQHTAFLGLKIIEFNDGEEEAYVTFEASLSSGILTEKSRFLKENGKWLYTDGLIS